MAEITINKNAREKKFQRLMRITDPERIADEATNMTYAEIVIMVIETERAGVHMPHNFLGVLKYNVAKKCCICGDTSGPRWPGPLRKPKEDRDRFNLFKFLPFLPTPSKNSNDGGFCNPCGDNVEQHKAWVRAESTRFFLIEENPIKTRTFIRRLHLFLVRWLDEEYIDPITFLPVKSSDRMKPRDLLPEHLVRSAILKLDVARAEVSAILEAL